LTVSSTICRMSTRASTSAVMRSASAVCTTGLRRPGSRWPRTARCRRPGCSSRWRAPTAGPAPTRARAGPPSRPKPTAPSDAPVPSAAERLQCRHLGAQPLQFLPLLGQELVGSHGRSRPLDVFGPAASLHSIGAFRAASGSGAAATAPDLSCGPVSDLIGCFRGLGEHVPQTGFLFGRQVRRH
jgi:hypothetical protein